MGLPEARRQTRQRRAGKGSAVAAHGHSTGRKDDRLYALGGKRRLQAPVDGGAERGETCFEAQRIYRPNRDNRVGISRGRNVVPGLLALVTSAHHRQHTHAGGLHGGAGAQGSMAVEVGVGIGAGGGVEEIIAQRGADDVHPGRVGVFGGGQPVGFLNRTLRGGILGDAQVVGGLRRSADEKAGLISRQRAQTRSAVAVAGKDVRAAIHEVAGAGQPALALQGSKRSNGVGAGKASVQHRNAHALAAKAGRVHGHGPQQLILPEGLTIRGAVVLRSERRPGPRRTSRRQNPIGDSGPGGHHVRSARRGGSRRQT